MRAFWQQFVGDAPPQPTVGPSVPPADMGPDSLRQLSPSDDREASRAQRKTGSKRAGSSVRRRSRISERSSTDWHRARVRWPPASPDSSSPTRRLSPPAKRSRWDQREVSNDSSSSEGRQRSSRPRRPRRSRSPLPRRCGSSPSPSPHGRYRSSPAPSHCPFGANMTRRPAGRPSLSPRWRSHSHHLRSRQPSRGRQSSPLSRSRGPHRWTTLSSSRSPSPQRHRNYSTSPRLHGSRSSSPERVSHPHASDIRLLRLRADDDDQRTASTHPPDSPDPEQSPPVDGSQLSAEKVQKLFADLIAPPALSHYADPIPDSAPNTQLVPMFGLLLPLLQLPITVNHWRLMDYSKTISPSIAFLEIHVTRRRHVRLRIMISLTWCYPKRRNHRSLMSLLHVQKRMIRFRVASLPPTKWSRNMKNNIFNGLLKVTIIRW